MSETNESDYDSYYNYSVYQDYEEGGIPSIPTEELLLPLLVYSVTFITGLLGNILILVAVASQKQVRQSPTNVFLASLATADLLLILICLPLKMGKLFSFSWQFGWMICKLTHYSETLSVVCSVLNLTALSVERYYAVVHPMKAQYMCTTSQAKKVTVMVWLLASLLALPTSVARVHLPVHDGSKFYCVLDWDRPWLFQSHEIYLLGVVLLIPGTIMVVSYISIICQLHRINIERRNLTLTTALPLTYKSARLDKVEGGPASSSTQGHNLETTETTEFSSRQGDSIKVTETEMVEQLDDGRPNRCWSMLNYRERKTRSQSVMVKKTRERQRRLSDCIGLAEEDSKPEKISRASPIQVSPHDKVVSREKETKQVIYMLILIMVLFFLCWAPILIFNVLAAFDILGEGNYGGTALNTKHIKTFFSLLSYANSCFNPLIYGFMSKHFRRSFTTSICLKPQGFGDNLS